MLGATWWTLVFVWCVSTWLLGHSSLSLIVLHMTSDELNSLAVVRKLACEKRSRGVFDSVPVIFRAIRFISIATSCFLAKISKRESMVDFNEQAPSIRGHFPFYSQTVSKQAKGWKFDTTAGQLSKQNLD